MDSNTRTCPFCQARTFEWQERDRSGWCLICGYFEYYPSFQKFLDNEDGTETVSV